MERGSLSVRLIAVWAVFLVITLQAASIGLQTLFERSITRRTLSELTLDLTLLGQALERENGSVKLVTAPTDPLFTVAFSGRYWQVSENGQAILRSPSLWDFKLALDNPTDLGASVSFVKLKGPEEQSLFGMSKNIVLDGDPKPTTYNIVAAVDYAEIERAKQRFSDDLLIGLTGLATLLLIAASAHVIIGLKPMKDIQNRLARVRNGEFRRLEGNFPAEVMPLVAETNALLDAQENALEVARTRAANLAHGLKTPLAVMAAQSRALRRRGDRDIASQIDLQVEAMRRHVERELARARARGAGPTHHGRIDTAVAIKDIVGAVKFLPRGQDLEWNLSLTAPLMLGVDRADFNELMGNLIDNAHKWARTRIAVQSRVDHDNAVFAVEDDGPGVDDADVARILQWGERADTSVPGTGMGLAITSDLVGMYNGRLDIGRSALGGLAATVTIAIANRPLRPASA